MDQIKQNHNNEKKNISRVALNKGLNTNVEKIHKMQQEILEIKSEKEKMDRKLTNELALARAESTEKEVGKNYN